MTKKRRVMGLACLMLMLWAFPAMAAEYALPIDSSGGFIPNPAGFTSLTAYQDESITVSVESRKIDDSVYHIAHVKIADASQLRTGLAGPSGVKKTAKTSAMAAAYSAVVAMNGDYYQYRSGGYVVRQGEVLRKTPNTKLDLLLVDEAGDFHIFKKSNKKELNAFLKGEHTAVNAFTFGPALVMDGKVQTIYNSYGFSPQDRSPRTAIGQTGPLQYVLVVVDGRQEGYSRGITLKKLAEFMGELGCVSAFNLDGGGSSTLIFGNEYVNKMDDKSERNISDIIYFATAVPETEWATVVNEESEAE